MDRKMRSEIRKPVRKAEALLKKAEKSTTKLANYDERVRDPEIKELERLKKSGHRSKKGKGRYG
jgi:hypothetical protein